tara:strand:- start:326 stop:496 length:171 start_codon:yes stop_codon:yes gene_type:complete
LAIGGSDEWYFSESGINFTGVFIVVSAGGIGTIGSEFVDGVVFVNFHIDDGIAEYI